MILRSTVDKILPIREGEVALTPGDRKLVFRGFYFHTSEVEQASDLGPFKSRYLTNVVRRWRGGFPHSTFRHPRNRPEISGNFHQAELNRATRVENVARGIKAVLVLSLVAGGVIGGIEVSSGNSSQEVNPGLTFDALGGGSNTIEVYPGPLGTPSDRRSDGTFENGQTAPVVCKTIGRLVTSNPSVGESYRESDTWYEVEVGGNHYFATATYADVSGGNIPECTT